MRRGRHLVVGEADGGRRLAVEVMGENARLGIEYL